MRCFRALPLLTAMAVATPLQAQAFIVGMHAGRTLAVQRGYLERPQRVPRNTFGGSMNADFTSWLALSWEANYVEKGGRQDLWVMRVSYLEGPATLRLSAPTGIARLRMFARGGIAYGMEWGCSGRAAPVGTNVPPVNALAVTPEVASMDCDDYRRDKTDMGRVVGAGLLLPRDRMRYSLEVRRFTGRHNIGADDYLIRNETVSLLFGAGYLLGAPSRPRSQ